MSNSDEKLNGGGRSNPITLNTINEKVRTLEGTTRVTPIKMSGLDSRINNLQNKTGYTTINVTRYQVYSIPKGYENSDLFAFGNDISNNYYLSRVNNNEIKLLKNSEKIGDFGLVAKIDGSNLKIEKFNGGLNENSLNVTVLLVRK